MRRALRAMQSKPTGTSLPEIQNGQPHDRMGSPGDAADVKGALPAQDNVDISATQRMLSAVSGSLLTSLLITPLDVVRVRLQTQALHINSSSSEALSRSTLSSFTNLPPNIGVTACCREVFWMNNTSSTCIAGGPSSSATFTSIASSFPRHSTAPLYPNTFDCAVDTRQQKEFSSTLDGLRKIARNEGVTSLWRGLSPTLVMVIPANVIYFSGYDFLRSNPNSFIRRHVSDTYAPLLAGALARAAAATTISPIEMLRTRMQASSSTGNGATILSDTFSGLRKMVEVQGVTSLWRGLSLTMWRDVPFSGTYWWGYEVVRNFLSSVRDGHRLVHALSSSFNQDGSPKGRARDHHPHTNTFTDSFIAGATSGAVASTLTMPFDVGKTRRQVTGNDTHLPSSSHATRSTASQNSVRPEDRSMPRFIYHIWRQEGMSGLFRGWTARTLKVAPACAIMISSYEVGKKMARRINASRSSTDV